MDAFAPTTIVMPAKAGIQYAARLQMTRTRCGVLGPRFRGDDAYCLVNTQS